MELKEYIKVFRRYWLFIIVFALFGATLAYFYSRQLPTGYKNTQAFFLSPASSQTNLEAYYAQEKARNFTDSAIAIIASSDFKSQILEPPESITVKKLSPQVLELVTFAKDSNQSAMLMEGTARIFNQRFSSNLQEIAPQSQPTFVAGARLGYTIAGFMAALAFAIFAVSLKTYFRI